MPTPARKNGAAATGGQEILPRIQSWSYRHRGFIAAATLGAAMLVASLSPLTGSRKPFADVFDSVGWLSFTVGVGMRFWSILYLGGRKHLVLVAHGPCSVCRNPLYWGSLFVAGSAALLAHSLVIAGGVSLLAIVYAAGIVPAEERELRAALGKEYRAYCERVPRFLPQLHLYYAPSRIEICLRSLCVEIQAALLYACIPILGTLIAHMRVCLS